MIKILFAVYDMHAGGVEKSLLDLLEVLSNIPEVELTLMLLQLKGEYLDRVPSGVKIQRIVLPDNILYELTESTPTAIKECLCKRKFITAGIIGMDYLRNRKSEQQTVLQNNYHRWRSKIKVLLDEYDIAIDYQGMGVFTTYYVAKFVNSKIKLSWIHNDINFMEGDLNWQEEIYKSFDKVYCVSKKAAEGVVKRMPFCKNKLDIFHNIIPKEQIIERSNEPCETISGDFKIVSIGRISYQKGYDVAVQAMKELLSRGFKFDYYIIGDGETRKSLERQIKELSIESVVHLLGFQSNPYKYLRQCDLYFQPSRFEGFCIALGEAKVLHLPIITTDFYGADEQIENGITGLIIPFDQKAMVTALEEMMQNTCLRKRIVEQLEATDMYNENDCHKLFDLLDMESEK